MGLTPVLGEAAMARMLVLQSVWGMDGLPGIDLEQGLPEALALKDLFRDPRDAQG